MADAGMSEDAMRWVPDEGREKDAPPFTPGALYVASAETTPPGRGWHALGSIRYGSMVTA